MYLNMSDGKMFYDADDIAEILNVSKPTAYRIIKKLNSELIEKGYITITGRVPKKYFDEKMYC